MPTETIKFLIEAVAGVHPHRSNSKKQARIQELVNSPETVAELQDFIATGLDVADLLETRTTSSGLFCRRFTGS